MGHCATGLFSLGSDGFQPLDARFEIPGAAFELSDSLVELRREGLDQRFDVGNILRCQESKHLRLTFYPLPRWGGDEGEGN